MSVDHAILCDGLSLSTRAQQWRTAKTVRLGIGNGAHDIHLDIGDIPKRLAADMSPVAADLIELAAYVYTADGACTRGGNHEFEYGEKWRRNFRFEVPVRVPDVWNAPSVKQALEATLGFLSDDDYDFRFHQHADPPPLDSYLPFRGPGDHASGVEEVMLFSGGLDSFAGAVQEVLVGRRRTALVSHVSTEKIGKPQRDLVADIAANCEPGRPRPWHVQVNLNKGKSLGRESTQRTRSFVYTALASVVAIMLERQRIRFYENGIISFNLPTSLQVLGGRASRTTHPRALRGLADLVGRLFECTFEIENPYLWTTKVEVLQQVKAAGFARLCAKTISCTRTLDRTIQHSHCGRCSQCIDRRLVALAAGFDDSEDPEVMYEVGMDAAREDECDRTMIERYIGEALRIRRMTTPDEFLAAHGEVARALGQLGTDTTTALTNVYDLHRRHAAHVRDALVTLITSNAGRLVDKTIPATSPIGIAAGLASNLGVELPVRADIGLSQAEDENSGLVVDRDRFEVRHRGKPCQLGNTIEFRVIERLARGRGTYISVDTLMDEVWDGETRTRGTVQKTISNLRRKLRDAGVDQVELDGSQRGHYALKISESGKR
jgi:hypothetical protein